MLSVLCVLFTFLLWKISNLPKSQENNAVPMSLLPSFNRDDILLCFIYFSHSTLTYIHFLEYIVILFFYY